jgi:hypothetical protein
MDPSVIATVVVGSTVVSALVTAFLGHWNELSRAREERRQKRLGETYVTAIEAILKVRHAIERTHPLVARPGEPDELALPTMEEQIPIQARLSAYGSPEMQRAYRAVQDEVWTFTKAVNGYDRLLVEALKSSGPDYPKKLADEHAVIVKVRERQVRPTMDAFFKLANAELAERRPGIWGRLRSRVWRPERRRKGDNS